MAGNTGKMTSEAIAARGPRMRLVSVKLAGLPIGSVVCREGASPFRRNFRDAAQAYKFRHLHTGIYAASYSLRYLLTVAKGCD